MVIIIPNSNSNRSRNHNANVTLRTSELSPKFGLARPSMRFVIPPDELYHLKADIIYATKQSAWVVVEYLFKIYGCACQWNNLRNRPIFNEVIDNNLVTYFLDHPVYEITVIDLRLILLLPTVILTFACIYNVRKLHCFFQELKSATVSPIIMQIVCFWLRGSLLTQILYCNYWNKYKIYSKNNNNLM